MFAGIFKFFARDASGLQETDDCGFHVAEFFFRAVCNVKIDSSEEIGWLIPNPFQGLHRVHPLLVAQFCCLLTMRAELDACV